MGAKLTTDTDIRADEKSGRSRPRRKIILNTPPRSKSEARPELANHPRKRNALGVERMAKMLPKNHAKTATASQSRPVVIGKTPNRNASEGIATAGGTDNQKQPGEKETSRNRGRMFVAILVAALMLGVFNSSALVNRVRGLPAGPVEDRIITTAETWNGWMENQGLSGYIEVARTYVAALKDKRWRDLERQITFSH